MQRQVNTDRLPAPSSYLDACNIWSMARQWRDKKGDYDDRQLDGSRAKHKVVRQLSDGSIAFRLYKTDAVIFHPDKTVTITPFPSQSTNRWIEHLTQNITNWRWSLKMQCTTSIGPTIWLRRIGGRHDYQGYVVCTFVRLKIVNVCNLKLWRIMPQKSDIYKLLQITINRKQSRELYRLSGYNDFRKWYVARKAIKPVEDIKHNWWDRHQVHHFDHEEVIEILRDPKRWLEFAEPSSGKLSLRYIREVIIAQSFINCHKYKKIPYLTHYSQLRSVIIDRKVKL